MQIDDITEKAKLVLGKAAFGFFKMNSMSGPVSQNWEDLSSPEQNEWISMVTTAVHAYQAAYYDEIDAEIARLNRGRNHES